MRHLFLVAYDISSNKTRRKVLRLIKGNAIGGQKSLYECFLTVVELQATMAEFRKLIDEKLDRVLFVRLDPRANIEIGGIAVAPSDHDFFYHG